jgi:hypothetical protein
MKIAHDKSYYCLYIKIFFLEFKPGKWNNYSENLHNSNFKNYAKRRIYARPFN